MVFLNLDGSLELNHFLPSYIRVSFIIHVVIIDGGILQHLFRAGAGDKEGVLVAFLSLVEF